MRYQGLDGLRGIAALAIAVFHFHGNWGGYLAVDLFLMLSGFVLAHRHAIKRESPAEFVVARIARLYPLHIVTLCLFVLVAVVTDYKEPLFSGELVSVLFQQLTITHNVGLNPTGLNFNYPSWSVSVEFWANILFVVVLIYLRNVYWLLVPAVIGLATIFFYIGHLDVHYQNVYGLVNLGLLRGVALFFVGVVLYAEQVRRQPSSDWLLDAVSLFAILAIVMVVFVRAEVTSMLDYLVVPLFALLIFSVSNDRGAMAVFFAKFAPIGEISYSIYLNQIMVLLLVRWLGDQMGGNEYLMFLVYIFLLVGMSKLTFAWVEVPLKISLSLFLTSRLPMSMRSAV